MSLPKVAESRLSARIDRLKSVGARRKGKRLAGYFSIGDFHNGAYETEYVSPWTKSAHKEDADIMIVAQDWASEKYLSRPLNPQLINLGYDPFLPTNQNLQALLHRHIGVGFEDVFATNVFPFVKPGSMSRKVNMTELSYCAGEFLFPQIEIVKPRLTIFLGLATYRAALHALGKKRPKKLASAIENPLSALNTAMHCVAHTGAWGTKQRGEHQIDSDWEALGKIYDSVA